MNMPQTILPPSAEERSLERLTEAYQAIIADVDDPSREGVADTPRRAAKAMQFLTRGYRQTLEDVINGAVFESACNEIVIVKNIELYSLCEHHLLPFIGKCHVGYIPGGKVLGLSKIARIVDMYARRLQIQENMTLQIAHAVQQAVSTEDVGVIIEANHLCMMMRGVEKQNSHMKTSAMLGAFRDSEKTRMEFLQLLRD